MGRKKMKDFKGYRVKVNDDDYINGRLVIKTIDSICCNNNLVIYEVQLDDGSIHLLYENEMIESN